MIAIEANNQYSNPCKNLNYAQRSILKKLNKYNNSFRCSFNGLYMFSSTSLSCCDSFLVLMGSSIIAVTFIDFKGGGQPLPHEILNYTYGHGS